MNERETIIFKLQEEFPEIFEDGVLSLNKVAQALNNLSPVYDQSITRIVLFEKKGYITGKRGKLLRALNKLNPKY